MLSALAHGEEDGFVKTLQPRYNTPMKNPIEAMFQPNPNDMPEIWIWALSWFSKPPQSPAKRMKQAVLVEVIKGEFAAQLEKRGISEDMSGLHSLYRADSAWALQIARREFPRDWPTLGVHATTAAAFGLRHVELMTGKTIDARQPLPGYVKEWATW